MESFQCKLCYYNDIDPFSTASTVAEPTIKPTFTFNKNVIIKQVFEEIYNILSPPQLLENSVLQLCKFRENQVEYGPFLDFDLSLHEQMEELDSFLDGSQITVVMRTKLAVRIEALIDKLNNASGRELRRALFSLKQIFQDDKDLVQEFVLRRGLNCLRQIGTKSDQNHQNYILRALGQLMLYVDGMNGVLADPETIEWLYSLLQGSYRLVVKLALKLLVVFIEYAKKPELHAMVIISSIAEYHRKAGGEPWTLTMKILAEEDSTDSELVTYAITFINKVLSAIPDQDTFYDVTDWLEGQGIEKISAEVLKKSNADVDMVKQFQIYETVLMIEDGNSNLSFEHDGIRNLPRAKSESNLNGKRKSKRQAPISDIEIPKSPKNKTITVDDGFDNRSTTELSVPTKVENGDSDIDESSKNDHHLRRASVAQMEHGYINGSSMQYNKYYTREKRMQRYKSIGNLSANRYLKYNNERKFLTSSELPSRPQSLLIEEPSESQESSNGQLVDDYSSSQLTTDKDDFSTMPTSPALKVQQDSPGPSSKVISPLSNQDLRRQSPAGEEDDPTNNKTSPIEKQSTGLSKPSVKAMKSQFASKNKQSEDAQKQLSPSGDISGIISTAKGNLLNNIDKPPMQVRNLATELMKESKVTVSNDSPDWDRLESELVMKPLKMKDWDFSDLTRSEDVTDSHNIRRDSITNGVPPPPPPIPPSIGRTPLSSQPPIPGPPKPPPAPAATKIQTNQNASKIPGTCTQKQKHTIRLHWRIPNPAYCDTKSTIWTKMKNVSFDSGNFESLFENKPHDTRKKHEAGPKKIEVLDLKRSNTINIGMTNLPPIPSIKSAILYMHTNIINREGVEKLLTTMLPTQEEIDNIRNAQNLNKDAPLGQAESFLLALHEVNLLQPRLEVWLFMLDFDQIERDIMDSLMDLMRGIKEIYESRTLIYVLSSVLALGNFLNGSQVTSFSLEYLQKVPEVKDTKYKHSLLYHVVSLVANQFADSTDLHSDLGALNRCHRIDWEELTKKLQKLMSDCKSCWDHLRPIFKSDETSIEITTRLKRVFWEASEAIIKMNIIHRRVMKRFVKVLEYLGFSQREAEEMKVRNFCRIMSDFAIEYRTTREKVEQLKEKKDKEKERKKTRGEMIVDINSLDRAKKHSQNHDNDLLTAIMSKKTLGNSDCELDFNSLNNRRQRRLTQNSISTEGLKSIPRTSSSQHMHIQDSSPIVSANITPAVSEMSLDQSDTFIDKLAQHATSSNSKRRTVRRSAGRERKSVRRTKPYIEEDVITNLLLSVNSTVS